MPGVLRDSALGKQRLAAAAKRQGGGRATPQSMAKGMARKTIPASTIAHVRNAPGLTASQRASLKQTPAQKQARMASAQGRMGTVVSNFAKRQRGEKTPTGVGRPAGSRMFPGRGAGAAISSLSRPLKRKTTSRGSSRSSGR